MGFSCKSALHYTELKSTDCGDFNFGMIEAKRILTEEEKKSLETQGIIVQEYLFDMVYQGIWRKNYPIKKLSASPIKNLKDYKLDDKLSEGIVLKNFEGDLTPCSIVIQSFIRLNEDEFKSYGKIVNYNNQYYRMDTQKKFVKDIVSHPCVKHVSIMKSNDIPDLKY